MLLDMLEMLEIFFLANFTSLGGGGGMFGPGQRLSRGFGDNGEASNFFVKNQCKIKIYSPIFDKYQEKFGFFQNFKTYFSNVSRTFGQNFLGMHL